VSAQIYAVVDTGTTIDAAGGQWPTAVIDASGHPETTDLAIDLDPRSLADVLAS
jgi:hypothetical protein